MNSFLSIWKLLNKQNKVYFIILVFLIIIQAFFEILSIAIVIPFVTILLDPNSISNIPFFSIFKPINFSINQQEMIILMSVLFLLAFILKNITVVIINKFLFDYVYNFRRDLAARVLKKYLHQDYMFFIKNSYSSIAANLSKEVENLSGVYFRPILIILSELIILISILILIVFSGYIEGFVIILPFVLLSALLFKGINKKVKSWANARVTNTKNLTKLTYEIILGIREILLIGKISEILKKYKLFQKESSSIESNVQLVQTLPRVTIELFAILLFLLTFVYLSFQNIDNKEIFVILSFYLAVAYRVTPSLNKIFVHYQQLKFGKPSVDIIIKDLNLRDKLYFFDNNKKKINFSKKIEFKNIEFQFEDRKKLFMENNFSILKNQIIGIYGESGSGKTTLLNILSLLINPKNCEILVDGKKIENSQDFRRYQNLISFVSQDTFLLEDSIKNNILFGSEQTVDDQKLKSALDFSSLSEFVEELPDKLDTIIGLNSKKISSGQRQRIALARLYYSSREILIFDEATNALDEKNEELIINNIINLKEIKTVIIVSHNKKNLLKCDKLFHVKNGSVTEEK